MAVTDKSSKAFAYLRTYSAANLGADKASSTRQLADTTAHAQRAGITIVDTYKDEAVSDANLIESRSGFMSMLERIEGIGARTILVETANRFARDLMVQKVGFQLLTQRGITIIAADSPLAFQDDTPTARLIRQVLGAVSEFEKAMLVAKLKGARDRKRKTGVRVECRKPLTEAKPETVQLAKKLNRNSPKGHKRSLRDISAELAAADHVIKAGTPYGATAIARMLKLPSPTVINARPPRVER